MRTKYNWKLNALVGMSIAGAGVLSAGPALALSVPGFG